MREPDNGDIAGLKVLTAGADAAGRRLDAWLAERLAPDLSRSRIQALIGAGAVSIGDEIVRDRNRRLETGDAIGVSLPEPRPAAPAGEAIPLSILFEDEAIVVLDKPPGLVVHPGAGNPASTLVNALIAHCGPSLSGIGGERRPGIVHRLDKDTSGVMVVAKTDRAHRALSEAFAAHGADGVLERAYTALVWGAPARAAGRVDAPLGRAPGRVRRAVVPAGRGDARRAVTNYRVVERFGPRDGPALAALLECRLETGRTHQIRVHMAHIGHPLIGDRDYGRGFRSKAQRLPEPLRAAVAGFARQALHAHLLAFVHPVSGEPMRFEAPPPEDMRKLLAGFRVSW